MTKSSFTVAVRKRDLTLPDFAPPLGKFANFTSNKPLDCGPAATGSLLANWCGGAFIRDFGTMGAVAYHGGGEHYEWRDYGGVLVLDIGARQFSMRCVPKLAPHWGVAGPDTKSPTDMFGAYADDGSPQSKHTYNGLQEFPAAWGGGPQGGLVRVAHSAGGCMPPDIAPYFKELGAARGSMGASATWAFDLSQAVDGHKRLTGDKFYHYDSTQAIAIVQDAPCSGIDYKRKGWWSKPRTGSQHGGRLCFTSNTGEIISYPSPLAEHNWCEIHCFDQEDLIVLLSGAACAGQEGVMVAPKPTSVDPNVENPPFIGVKQTNFPYPNFDNAPYLGYMGMRWCDHPNEQAFIGIDYYNRIDTTHVRLLRLTPPPVGKRYNATDPWVWSEEVIASHDGSEIDVKLDESSINGSFSKMVYCPKVKSFVWTRHVGALGQLLRTSRMT